MESQLDKEIEEELGQHDPKLKRLWQKHSPVKNVPDSKSDMQEINRFLRTQLGLLDADTIEARTCLNTNQSKRTWMKGFREVIAPVIRQHGLPVWKGN